MAADPNNLIWIDMEMTGLQPDSDRVIEIAQMREEPVIEKEAFVREEVIVRKTVQERTETVRDTVRRTDFEREELSGAEQGRD